MSGLEFNVTVLTVVAVLTFCSAIKRICKKITRRNRQHDDWYRQRFAHPYFRWYGLQHKNYWCVALKNMRRRSKTTEMRRRIIVGQGLRASLAGGSGRKATWAAGKCRRKAEIEQLRIIDVIKSMVGQLYLIRTDSLPQSLLFPPCK